MDWPQVSHVCIAGAVDNPFSQNGHPAGLALGDDALKRKTLIRTIKFNSETWVRVTYLTEFITMVVKSFKYGENARWALICREIMEKRIRQLI